MLSGGNMPEPEKFKVKILYSGGILVSNGKYSPYNRYVNYKGVPVRAEFIDDCAGAGWYFGIEDDKFPLKPHVWPEARPESMFSGGYNPERNDEHIIVPYSMKKDFET